MLQRAMFTLVITAFSLVFSAAQLSDVLTEEKKNSLFEYIRLQSGASLHLSFDFENFLYDRKSTQRNPCVLALTSSSIDPFISSCDILLRGEFRRENCDFPPFKLDFDEDDLQKLSLKRNDEYKFVTHCMDNRFAKQTLAREYVTYRLYRSLSEYGYSTSLLPIVYRDVDSDSQVQDYVIMLESEKGMAQRLNCSWHDGKVSNEDLLNAYHYELFALFQYMIGNRDVSIAADQNVKFIEHQGELIPIPYDFDFSLFVNAPYAFPSGSDQIERMYLGHRENQYVMDRVFERFRSKEGEFYELIDNCKVLRKHHRTQCKDQIKAFFIELEKLNYQMIYRQ